MPRQQPQRKYFDIGPTAVATTAVYTGGVTGYASGIADATTNGANCWLSQLLQSVNVQGRVGQSIVCETLDFRVKINWDLQSSVGVTQHLRMLLFADNECDGTAPNISDILTQSTIANGAQISMLNPSFFGRFKILKDEVFSTTQNGGIQHPNNSIYREFHFDLHDHLIMWDNTNSSLITNARQGHLFVYFFFEQDTVATGGIITAATTNPPGVQYVSRIRYRDDQV